MGRPLREGVGRNIGRPQGSGAARVALYARAWVEITLQSAIILALIVALYARAWVEIRLWRQDADVGFVALYARAWVEIRC